MNRDYDRSQMTGTATETQPSHSMKAHLGYLDALLDNARQTSDQARAIRAVMEGHHPQPPRAVQNEPKADGLIAEFNIRLQALDQEMNEIRGQLGAIGNSLG